MELELTAVRLERALTPAERTRLAALLPPERSGRRADDEALCAYAALREMLLPFMGREGWPPLFQTSHGRPMLASGPRFSLSHTRGAALAGVHTSPLGVDIERIRPVHARLLRLTGTAEETAFFQEWTRRESSVKRQGMGFDALRHPRKQAGERFLPFVPFPGYAACACTASCGATLSLRRLTLEELLTLVGD